MQVETIVVGSFQVNCYVVIESGTCLVIDPGADGPSVSDMIRACGATPKAILLTHAHCDHIGAVKVLAEEWDVPVVLHPDDVGLYEHPSNSMPDLYPYEERAKSVATMDAVVSEFSVSMIHTPGHSPGGRTYYFPNEKIAFTGDTLFCGSIGRDDLPGGNYDQLIHSIKTQLMTLPDDVTLYPGHGPSTTVLQERSTNPFLV